MKRLRNILEDNVDERFYLSEEKTVKLVEQLSAKEGLQQTGYIEKNMQGNRVYDANGVDATVASQTGGGNTEPKIAEEVRPILTPDRLEKRQNGRRFKEDGEPMFTLTAQDRHGVAILRPVRTEYGKKIRSKYESGEIQESRHNMTTLQPRWDGTSNTLTTVQKDNLLLEQPKYRIRKLTPLECFRLQAFPDEYHEILSANGISNTQLYKMAGNAVTVSVIDAIGKRLIPYLTNNKEVITYQPAQTNYTNMPLITP